MSNDLAGEVPDLLSFLVSFLQSLREILDVTSGWIDHFHAI